jgi:hypothetical protein
VMHKLSLNENSSATNDFGFGGILNHNREIPDQLVRYS